MGLLDSIVLLVIIISLCAYINHRYVTDWSIVSLNDVALSDTIPLFWFAILRYLFAFIVWGTTAYSVFDREGLTLELRNREGKFVKFKVKYLQRLTFFTFWCWMLHGFYFLLSGTASFSLLLGISLDEIIGAQWIQTFTAVTWVAYEVSFSTFF